MQIVEFWAKGYPNEDGPSRIQIEEYESPAAAVCKIAGPFAKIFNVRPLLSKLSGLSPQQTQAYVELFKGDNS